jgi:hypothetical protein
LWPAAGKLTLVAHGRSEAGDGIIFVSALNAALPTADALDALIIAKALEQYRALDPKPFARAGALPGGLELRHKAAAEAYRLANPGEDGWLPTIVFDIHQSSDGSLIKRIYARLKELTCDQAACRAIVVLSSASTVAELTDDRWRQQFVRVPAFSLGEASAALDMFLCKELPKEVASEAAVGTIKTRVLSLTTVALCLENLVSQWEGSASEADHLARAEAWACNFEAIARDDVRGAKNKARNIFVRDDDGTERASCVPGLMREPGSFLVFFASGPFEDVESPPPSSHPRRRKEVRLSRRATRGRGTEVAAERPPFADASSRLLCECTGIAGGLASASTDRRYASLHCARMVRAGGKRASAADAMSE